MLKSILIYSNLNKTFFRCEVSTEAPDFNTLSEVVQVKTNIFFIFYNSLHIYLHIASHITLHITLNITLHITLNITLHITLQFRDVNVLIILDFSFRYDSVHQKYKRLKRYVAYYENVWHRVTLS